MRHCVFLFLLFAAWTSGEVPLGWKCLGADPRGLQIPQHPGQVSSVLLDRRVWSEVMSNNAGPSWTSSLPSTGSLWEFIVDSDEMFDCVGASPGVQNPLLWTIVFLYKQSRGRFSLPAVSQTLVEDGLLQGCTLLPAELFALPRARKGPVQLPQDWVCCR